MSNVVTVAVPNVLHKNCVFGHSAGLSSTTSVHVRIQCSFFPEQRLWGFKMGLGSSLGSLVQIVQHGTIII
jgi:hypothetical protein